MRLCACESVKPHLRLQSVGTLLLRAEGLLQHLNVLLAVRVLIGQRFQFGLQGLHVCLLPVQLLLQLLYLPNHRVTRSEIASRASRPSLEELTRLCEQTRETLKLCCLLENITRVIQIYHDRFIWTKKKTTKDILQY